MTHDHPPAGQTLADIVVGVAIEFEGDAARQERAETPPGGAAEADPDRVLRQPGMAIAPRDFARKHRADGSMDVPDLAFDAHRLALVERLLRRRDQLVVERLVEVMVLALTIVDRHPRLRLGAMEQPREIDAFGLPMLDCP